MNTTVPIMIAHGERAILPVLLLMVALLIVIYPGALWVVANSKDRSHRRVVIFCAGLIVLGCGSMAIMVLKEFGWPPELGDWVGFSIWAIPAACGLVAITKATRAWHESDPGN